MLALDGFGDDGHWPGLRSQMNVPHTHFRLCSIERILLISFHRARAISTRR